MLLGRALHRRVAWLALFALWLQLGLSFGHIHPEDFFGLGGDQQPQLFAAKHAPSDLPLGPASGMLGHESCAICASMALVGTLTLPAPPAIEPPRFARGAPPPIYDSPALVSTPHLLFQTRAPPVA